MLVKYKKIMVMGIGITGISSLKLLSQYNNDLSVYDEKPESEIYQILNDNNLEDIGIIQDETINMVQDMDFIVKSPGISPRHKVIEFAEKKEIPVISDIELAYNMGIKGTIIGITGTNGKTTSTMLTGEILKRTGHNTHIAGNMGKGILQVVEDVGQEDYLVLELSSFQLEHTYLFKPKVSLILNITDDHLDWHGTFENYMSSKFKIFANQSGEDFIVLNWDDENLRKLMDKTRASVIWFSVREELEQGVFLSNGNIVYRIDNHEEVVISTDKIRIPGNHNIENICGVIGIMKALNVENHIISSTIQGFEGVEHRIEFVRRVNDIQYYNDSKGTNVESTIKAIQALGGPIVLIAGGYDKGAQYSDLMSNFKQKSRALILIGATAQAIRTAAINQGVDNIHMATDMDEAVRLAASMAEKGDQVLLSPACASWDMYKNFEERGNHFKRIVKQMTE